MFVAKIFSLHMHWFASALNRGWQADERFQDQAETRMIAKMNTIPSLPLIHLHHYSIP